MLTVDREKLRNLRRQIEKNGLQKPETGFFFWKIGKNY